MGLLLTMLDRAQYNFYAKIIEAHVDRIAPDIIHQHDYLASMRLSRRLSKKYPTVFTNHLGEFLFLEKTALSRKLQNALVGTFDQIIAPSKELLPSGSNCHYVPNGYDTTVFHPIPAEQRRSLREKRKCVDKCVFVCARRWAPTKGIKFLAEAIALLREDVRERCVFLFAGNDSPGYDRYRHQVRHILDQTEGTDIRILGNLDHKQLPEVVNLADVVVIPSLMEATSLFCLESMGCAKPVLASRTGGLPELIADGDNGWLVPPGDSRALAKQISDIVDTPEDTLLAMGKAARSLVVKDYNWDTIAGRTTEIYELARHAAESSADPQLDDIHRLGAA